MPPQSVCSALDTQLTPVSQKLTLGLTDGGHAFVLVCFLLMKKIQPQT